MKDRQKSILELLDTSGVRLHALLARIMLSQDGVADLMQELFIRLSNSTGFDRAKDPFAYARRAAINLAFEWRRKLKLTFQSLGEIGENCLPGETHRSPLAIMSQAEELEQVLDAMSRLNSLAREVLVMRYFEQESHEDIARRLGKRPQHVRSLTSKALAKLRKLLVSKNTCPSRKEQSYGYNR